MSELAHSVIDHVKLVATLASDIRTGTLRNNELFSPHSINIVRWNFWNNVINYGNSPSR